MALHYETVAGEALKPYIPALGALRIAIFREYPYLYEGTLAYEESYLQVYLNCPRSLVGLAFADGELVGATTCLPMEDEGPEFQAPFIAHGYDLAKICYFGESILLPEFRGMGAGKAFMHIRESHARQLPGITWTTFCAVDRPAEHPLRPANYRPLDSFWTSQGYVKQPHLQTTFSWKEIGESAESPKSMTFWMKQLIP
jgi:GNAT superfamily N-acetyltransferase